MKAVIVLAVYLCSPLRSAEQDLDNIGTMFEQQVETMADREGMENEDDSFLVKLENFRKHPLNLNKADAEDLHDLILLNDLQIDNFLKYRQFLGNIIDVYELQAVPSWNLSLIQKLRPFITVSQDADIVTGIRDRWADGNHTILIRTSSLLEKSEGFLTDSANKFTGSAYRLMVRYSYNYRNLLQWGVLGDKDAGEQFFKGSQKSGFDFYSFHFFISRLGMMKSMAIGDFTVNMGQGLIHSQGLAFKKSAAIASVKRQSPTIRPYTAAGEYNFHRGAGITLQKNHWESTLFLSLRKLSGNLFKDSVMDAGHISSILTSGYHRTSNELDDRNNLKQLTAGASLRYSFNNVQVAANAIQYKFSLPLKKEDKPYNLFAPSGKNYSNESIDYSYTYKNLHLFGELAVDKNLNRAFLNGLVASVSQAVDLSLVFRSLGRKYQSFYANAFSENSIPANERGFYTGICVRTSESLQIYAFMDRYHFPWLKYRVDAPSTGKDFFVKLVYKPNKLAELYVQYRSDLKEQNLSEPELTTSVLGDITRHNWRIHSVFSVSRAFIIRNRIDMILYNKKQSTEEAGFLLLTDILCKPVMRNWSANMRLLYFETSGYNSRLYAFENDVLFNFSVPAVFDRGYRYYININYNVKKLAPQLVSKKINIECWLKASQTFYPEKKIIGSGPDEIAGDKKTEIKFQIMIFF